MHDTVVLLSVLVLGVAVAQLGARAGEEPAAVPLEATLEDPPATGLAVLQVVEGSEAARVGVRLGDVIVAYDGLATTTEDALARAKEAASAKERVTVVLVRADGARAEAEVASGPLGVRVAPVAKGEGVGPLPAATAVVLDWTALEKAPQDDWYTFHLGPGPKKGFEHARVSLEGGRITMRREVAFDGGEQWGLNHFDVTVVVTAEDPPRLVSVRFENPVTAYVGVGEVAAREDGARELRFRWRQGADDDAGERRTVLPPDLPVVAGYFVETLATFMPREQGVCLHLRPVVDGWGTLEVRTALVCAAKETVDLAGEETPAWRFEQRSLAGNVVGTYWVGETGRVVASDYGGAQARRATKEEALADLPEGIRPRSAD